MKHLFEVHKHFEMHQVRPETYASEWLFSVFQSVIPESNSEVSAAFFTLFFKFKWEFFYKLVLTIFKHIQKDVLKHEEMFGILQCIKMAMCTKNDPYYHAKSLEMEQ